MKPVTFITGASGAIGSACAKKLAENGHQLLLQYYSGEERIKELTASLPEGRVLAAIQADLSSKEGQQHLLSFLTFPIDHLLIAGGTSYFGLFQEMEEEDMDYLLALHVKAPWLLAKAVLPAMIQKKQGSITLISSIWGERGASYEVAYSTVKGAQTAFVKALAKEAGPSGIRVNGLTPGLINSPMNQSLTKEELTELADGIPLGRAGLPEEAANAAAFLLSEQASYINGHLLAVNGGW